MIIRQTAGYFEITFSDWDFRRAGGGAMAMIQEIKSRIPSAIHDRTGYSYDPETKTWYIPITPANEYIIRECKEKYFSDDNQLTLFTD